MIKNCKIAIRDLIIFYFCLCVERRISENKKLWHIPNENSIMSSRGTEQ